MAPVVRGLLAAFVRFEWYFKPPEISGKDDELVIGGIATDQADLDARLTLNAAERSVFGLAWFLSLHLLQPRERRRVLAIDDAAAAFDVPNQAAFVSTLRALSGFRARSRSSPSRTTPPLPNCSRRNWPQSRIGPPRWLGSGVNATWRTRASPHRGVRRARSSQSDLARLGLPGLAPAPPPDLDAAPRRPRRRRARARRGWGADDEDLEAHYLPRSPARCRRRRAPRPTASARRSRRQLYPSVLAQDYVDLLLLLVRSRERMKRRSCTLIINLLS